ncbi:MAG: RecA/RadA recombinase [Candidatus Methanohalarchaeum thermophilum]|uniref:RecA/RadA recombinase n=1 Tax=Methanohalarchaeum thermophilum TaxID=1903181 RepID=A0A1Q6DTA4_METT1|nr:MAG: RecA/RadA recombinase [Candidatus Methanohalarchaeum thermophilum]
MNLSFGCSELDQLIEKCGPGDITQLFGKKDIDKSILCIQAAVNCLKDDNRCIYIATGKFPTTRFKQFAGEDASDLAPRLLVSEPKNFDEHKSAIKKVAEVSDLESINLVIIDSPTDFYSALGDVERAITLKKLLSKQLAYLIGLGRRYGFSILITNRVYEDDISGEKNIRGGKMLLDLSRYVVEVKKEGKRFRRAILRKGESNLEGKKIDFYLNDGEIYCP